MKPKLDLVDNNQSRRDKDCEGCGPPPSPVDSLPASLPPSAPSAMINDVTSPTFPSLIGTVTAAAATAKTTSSMDMEMEVPSLPSRKP